MNLFDGLLSIELHEQSARAVKPLEWPRLLVIYFQAVFDSLRAVVRALDAYGPDCVLIEGPADADPLLACALRETREETGVDLAAEALVPWAHWTTPEIQPIRYDTSFYLAVLPAGQLAQDTSSETASAGWVTPFDAVNAYRAGSLQLMPPTLSILLELAELPSVAAAIEVGRDRVIEPVLPRVVREAVGWVFRYPQPGSGDD